MHYKEIAVKFGEKLKTLRKKQNLTQEQVATAINVSRRAYIAYEQENTRPRKQETYELLAKVLDCDVNYLRIEDASSELGTYAALVATSALGTLVSAPTGIAALLSGAGTIMGLHTHRKKASQREKQSQSLSYTNDVMLQFEKRLKRFSATALGTLYSAAAKKGIVCQQGDIKSIDIYEGRPDDFIIVTNNSIQEWWLVFWTRDKEFEKSFVMFLKDRAAVLISRFVTAAADPRRLATIVVDDAELFDAVCKYKDHNSYRGNLSVLLLDTENVAVVREERLSSYSEEDKDNIFFSVV